MVVVSMGIHCAIFLLLFVSANLCSQMLKEDCKFAVWIV